MNEKEWVIECTNARNIKNRLSFYRAITHPPSSLMAGSTGSFGPFWVSSVVLPGRSIKSRWPRRHAHSPRCWSSFGQTRRENSFSINYSLYRLCGLMWICYHLVSSRVFMLQSFGIFAVSAMTVFHLFSPAVFSTLLGCQLQTSGKLTWSCLIHFILLSEKKMCPQRILGHLYLYKRPTEVRSRMNFKKHLNQLRNLQSFEASLEPWNARGGRFCLMPIFLV